VVANCLLYSWFIYNGRWMCGAVPKKDGPGGASSVLHLPSREGSIYCLSCSGPHIGQGDSCYQEDQFGAGADHQQASALSSADRVVEDPVCSVR
jgi:hypothetical protein